MTPFEPWEEIKKETDSGRTKTFNWFCDDTWRFEDFSSKACQYFNICSTPEPSFLEKFKEIGYNNILLGAWHSNKDNHPFIDFKDKSLEVSFAGRIDFLRSPFIEMLKTYEIPVTHITNVSYEELMMSYSSSKIGLNFSVNPNDKELKTQMKARMFEVPAANSLLLTQHHEGIENFFETDKKLKFLIKNPKIVEKLCYNGYQRFLKEHESHIRLEKILEKINAK